MEGNSENGRAFRVHREFECSRFEQAMLAKAYRRILPSDHLKLLGSIAADCDASEGQCVLHGDTDWAPHYFRTTGGSSR